MKLRAIAACGCLLVLSTVRAGEPEVAFLRERVSVTTPYGVTGLAPGTRVTVVSRHGGVVTVKSEDQQFDVSSDKLFTDAEAARSLSARDADEQQAAHQQIAQQEAAKRAAQQHAYQSASPSDPKAVLNAQLQQIQNQRHALEDELGRVYDAQKDAGPENRVKYTKKHTAWGHIRSITTSPNAAALAHREKELRQQIEDLKQKEKLLHEQRK